MTGSTYRVVLPFGALVGDNRRLIPVRGRLILSSEYRAAKAAVRTIAEQAARAAGWHPLDGDVALDALLIPPDRRTRDAGNYRKLVTDALAGVAYHDDGQVIDDRWRRGPVDRAAPRLEIVVQAAHVQAAHVQAAHVQAAHAAGPGAAPARARGRASASAHDDDA